MSYAQINPETLIRDTQPHDEGIFLGQKPPSKTYQTMFGNLVCEDKLELKQMIEEQYKVELKSSEVGYAGEAPMFFGFKGKQNA